MMKDLINKKDLCKRHSKEIEKKKVFLIKKRKMKLLMEKILPLIKNVLNIYYIINH